MNTLALLLALAPAPQFPHTPIAPVAPVPPPAPVASRAPVAAPAPEASAFWQQFAARAQREPADVESAMAALAEAEHRLLKARERLAQLEQRPAEATDAEASAPAARRAFFPAEPGAPWTRTLRPGAFAGANGESPVEVWVHRDLRAELLRTIEGAQGGSVPAEELKRLLDEAQTRSRAAGTYAIATGKVAAGGATGGGGDTRTRIWIDGREVVLKGDSVLQFRDGQPEVVGGEGVQVHRGGEGERRYVTVHTLPEANQIHIPGESKARWLGDNVQIVRENGSTRVLRVSPEPGAEAVDTRAVESPFSPSVASTSAAQGSPIVEVDPSEQGVARLLETLNGELSALRRDLNDLRRRVEQR